MAHSLSCPHTPAGLGMLPLLTHTPSGGSSCRGSVYPPHPAEVGLQDWHHLGMAPRVGNPFSHSPSLLAVPPQLPSPSCSIRAMLSPLWMLRIPVGSIPWVFGCLGSVSWARGRAGPGCAAAARGRRAAVFIFHLLQGTTGKFFFFFCYSFYFFEALCVLHQPESIM